MIRKYLLKILGKNTFTTRADLFYRIFPFIIKNKIIGSYYEFGTFQGFSLINFYKTLMYFEKNEGLKIVNKIYAFDSFQGLPEEYNDKRLVNYDVFNKGDYSCSKQQLISNLNKKSCNISRFEFVEGFFADSLSKINFKTMSKASIVHIDVDLYSSCADILMNLSNFIQDGTIIIFDDYFCYKGNPRYGVQAAFKEWLEIHSTEWSSQCYFTYGWSGACFILSDINN